MSVRRTPDYHRLRHVAGSHAGFPGYEIASRISVKAEILVRLINRIFVKLRIHLPIIVHSVELQKSSSIQHCLVAIQVSSNFATPPPYLQFAGHYTTDTRLI